MAVFFEDIGAHIDGTQVQASSARMAGTADFQAVRAVGYAGPLGYVPGGPPGGSADIDMVGEAPAFYISDGTTYKEIKVGTMKLAKGLMTSLSVTAEPNQVVSSSSSWTSFEPPDGSAGAGLGGTATDPVNDGKLLMHGVGSGPTGYSRAEFSFSQSFETIPQLGTWCPLVTYRSDGSKTVTVEGPSVGDIFNPCSTKCPKSGSASFEVGSMCYGTGGRSYSASGYMTESGVTVSEGGVMSGTLSAVEFF